MKKQREIQLHHLYLTKKILKLNKHFVSFDKEQSDDSSSSEDSDEESDEDLAENTYQPAVSNFQAPGVNYPTQNMFGAPLGGNSI